MAPVGPGARRCGSLFLRNKHLVAPARAEDYNFSHSSSSNTNYHLSSTQQCFIDRHGFGCSCKIVSRNEKALGVSVHIMWRESASFEEHSSKVSWTISSNRYAGLAASTTARQKARKAF
eukprot:15931-Heterococcus_DN1.PRE.1